MSSFVDLRRSADAAGAVARPALTAAVVRIGGVEIDMRRHEIRRGGKTIRLQLQPFQILALLMEHAGGVVTRQDIERRLWPDGTTVDFEHSVNAAIRRLRVALGDDALEPRFVETVPRRGYRFGAPVARTAPRESDAGLEALLAPHRAFIEGRAALETLEGDRVARARSVRGRAGQRARVRGGACRARQRLRDAVRDDARRSGA